MKVTNQNGFSAVEGVLIIVIVALLGGLGYYVMRQNNDSNNSGNEQSLINPNLASQKVGTIEGIEAVADESAADDAVVASELEQDSYTNALADAEALESVGDAVNENSL